MEKEQPKLQTEALAFNLQHFDTRISLEEAAMYSKMFGGIDGAIAYQQFRRQHNGEAITPSASRIDRVTNNFYSNIEEIFGIDSCEVSRFTAQMMEGATDAIHKLITTTAPSLLRKLEPRNEVLLLRENFDIERIIELLAREDNPRLQFETERHLILGYFWGLMQRRNELLSLSKVVTDSHKALERHFYEPQLLTMRLYSLHDMNPENLNAVLEINGEGPFSSTFKDGAWKEHDFDLRVSKSGDLFYTSPRVKNTTKALLKVIGKAANNGGEMNIEYVEDNAGIMLVHMGRFDKSGRWNEPTDVDSERALIEIVDSIANSKNVEWYTEDDEVVDPSDLRGQSVHHTFKRRQVYFEDVTVNGNPMPLEIALYPSPEDYLNSRFHIGRQDAVSGHYDGAAHDLFMWKRNVKIMSKVFPGDNGLYDQQLIRQATQKQQQAIIGDLLSHNLYEHQTYEPSL